MYLQRPTTLSRCDLDSSISIVLPVHNAEFQLAARVGHLLEILPDIARHFEILIVDDGSIDHTDDVGHELSQRYPQIRLLRHPFHRGPDDAARTGLMHARGDVIFIQEDGQEVSAEQLRRLWEMRNDELLVMARSTSGPQAINYRLLDRLQAWGMKLKELADEDNHKGLQMIRRRAVQQTA